MTAFERIFFSIQDRFLSFQSILDYKGTIEYFLIYQKIPFIFPIPS